MARSNAHISLDAIALGGAGPLTDSAELQV